MMPKSTATSWPASSTNRLPGCMSAWKKPSRRAWRRKLWITLRPSSGRSSLRRSSAARSLQRDAVDPFQRQHVAGGAIPVDAGTRKSASSRVFSAISDRAAASSRKSISIATERDSVMHDLDQPQPPRLGRKALRPVARRKRSAQVAAKRALDTGSQHFHRDRLAGRAARSRPDAPARSRPLRPAGRNLRNTSRQRLAERLRDHGFGFRSAERAACGPAGFRGRARARRRRRRGASPGTVRA